MNLANKITVLRIALIPLYLVFLLQLSTLAGYIAVGIFILASLSDALDGYVARAHGLVTVFGKFFDPLADKLLVCSALITMSYLERFPLWGVLLIVSRELIITAFREVAAARGVIIAADKLGKIKTFSQMSAIIFLTLPGVAYNHPLTQVLSWFVVIITIVSGISYVYKNKQVLKD